MTDKINSTNSNSSSSDDEEEEEDSSTSSSSTSSGEDDDDGKNSEQADEDQSDDSTTMTTKLPPKQVYLTLENKRKTLGKRLLQLRDELKAQPQADIDVKKRLLTEIKNVRERWIAVQTRITNVKARLSHSPTPERKVVRIPSVTVRPERKKPEPIPPIVEPETRIVPPPRERRERRSSDSESSRSRSRSPSPHSSRRMRRAKTLLDKPYRDYDAVDDANDQFGTSGIQTSALASRGIQSSTNVTLPTTSYRDLIEEEEEEEDRSPSLSPTPSPPTILPPVSNLNELSLGDRTQIESTISREHKDSILENPTVEDNGEKFTCSNSNNVPYPVMDDKRDLEIINRQLKDHLRQLEASCKYRLYENQSNDKNNHDEETIHIERLKKQIEYVNVRMKIERLKRTQSKTQREKEQTKRQLHLHIQEVRKLQRFMRSANRDFRNFASYPQAENLLPSLPPSPEMKQPEQEEELKLPPFDLHRVTGKKIVFASSDSDDDEEKESDPQVPVSLSASDPRAVPDGLSLSSPSLPMPSASSDTLDAIKTRVASLLSAPTTSSDVVSTGEVADDENDQPLSTINPERSGAISAKFNRKRRKTKKSKSQKKKNKAQAMADNEPVIVDQEEAWKRHVAMQLQYSFLKGANPILRALTAEAYKKLGINAEDVNEIPFDGEMMDYETALILQQQQEFLAAAAANPFNVLHNAAAGRSSSMPNLVDVLSNLNGGITPSSSEPQTPMGLLQKFFLDANKNGNTTHRSGELSNTPPTPPPPPDIAVGKKIVESLTNQDISELLKLSGSEHDDDDDEDEDDQSLDGDSDDETNTFSMDDNLNDFVNGNGHENRYQRWERPTPAPPRSQSSSTSSSKKMTMETLLLPSFNRCTHLGKSIKRSTGAERMFPSFSKHTAVPSTTLNLILYGLSSAQ